MDTWTVVLIVIGAVAITSGVKDYFFRRELQEMMGLLNATVVQLMRTEAELAELKGNTEDAEMFKQMETAIKDYPV